MKCMYIYSSWRFFCCIRMFSQYFLPRSDGWCLGHVSLGANGTTGEGEFGRIGSRKRNSDG